MMADVLGHPVVISNVPEASSRGAALLALESLGIIQNLEQIPTPLGKVFLPDGKRHERYLEGMRRQDELYNLLIRNTLNMK
jgi:gluconokinase